MSVVIPEIEFRSFGKIPRLNRDIVITEKIDGTNALVYIDEEGNVHAGSRTRWITPEQDNFGFATWVSEHEDELRDLGPGHHYGEWWGSGIQRGYGKTNGERVFSLFNVGRWNHLLAGTKYEAPSECCQVVPLLYCGAFSQITIDGWISLLKQSGSYLDPGTPAEGIMVYHTAAGQYFKVTCENDEKPKGQNNG